MIGFGVTAKADEAAIGWSSTQHASTRSTDDDLDSSSVCDDGVELTYNLSEPRNHSYVVNGVVVRNC